MTYDEMLSALSALMHRPADASLAANAPFAMESARLALSRTLRVNEGVNIYSAAPVGDTGAAVAPLLLVQVQAIYENTGGDALRLVGLRNWTGAEGEFAQFGTGLYLPKGAGRIFNVWGYYGPSPISGGLANWASLYFPDAWVLAAAEHQYRFLLDGEAADQMSKAWQGMVSRANAASAEQQTAGGGIRMSSR
jgi:hypothetical protein